MDEETQEKMDRLYANIWFWLEDETQKAKDQVMKMLGYRKLPKDRPPLIDIKDITSKVASEQWLSLGEKVGLGIIAQAQREADIKWYGGKND